jgi:thiosulfate dehydrogenase
MKLFVAGLVVGTIIFPLAFYFYFATGGAPVGTAESAMPFEKMLAHKALNARIQREMPKNAPIQGDEANLTAGAKIYREHCAVCHGLPAQHETAIATGMYPSPPKLLEGKGVTDDEPGESYWKVAHGIRLTGMPGFDKSLSETEMWQVSFLVAQADKLPKAASDALSSPTAGDDLHKSKQGK